MGISPSRMGLPGVNTAATEPSLGSGYANIRGRPAAVVFDGRGVLPTGRWRVAGMALQC